MPGELDSCATRKDLHVAVMRREALEQHVDQAALAADPGNDGICHLSQLQALGGALLGRSGRSAD